MDLRKDFPIFENNKDLIFFDNGSSSQKPKKVIDAISSLYSNDYANIHRGVYDLSQRSEEIYQNSKEAVRDLINAKSKKEIIYTYNSTYASNIITQSLKKSEKLKAGDKVLLSISEHHANIVPWLILKEEIGIELDFVNVTKDYRLDIEDFKNKYDASVKAVSLTYVSNVLGAINDLKSISNLLGDDTLFIIDGSQSVPHFKTDVKDLNCDFMFFTGHKMMAETGIGVLYGKEELLRELKAPISGGGAISLVTKEEYKSADLPEKFEAGTPNIAGASSLLAAINYMKEIGGYEAMENHENELIKYTLDNFEKIEGLTLYGPKSSENRIGVFSFTIDGIHHSDVSDFLAENGICIRSGKHCTEPLMDNFKEIGTNRMSLYIYNSKTEIDKFFEVLNECIKLYK